METKQKLDTLCSSLCYAMGIDAPKSSALSNKTLNDYIDKCLLNNKADRIFMYNPDAVAKWVFDKYSYILRDVVSVTDVSVDFETVMPSVTPVCFGTMYTGAQPAVHGIQKYEKPVITIDTIFDALIRNGKKCVIVAETNSSLSKIYLERDMDYFIYDTIGEVNAKASEIIVEDKYDFVVVYNGNYDTVMHKFGPESKEALAELGANVKAYAMFDAMIQNNWQKHNTLIGFAMDHGCHEIDGGCGSHGLDMDEDLYITHRYKIHGRKI